MNEYKNAGIGLMKMHKAMKNIIIATIATILLSWIPILPYLIIIAIFVFVVQHWIGMFYVGKDIQLCKIAFILQVISLVVSVLSVFVSQLSSVGTITGFLPLVAELMLIGSVTKIMKEKGATEAEKWGKLAFWFSVATEVCTILSTFLSVILLFSGAYSISLLLLVVTGGLAIAFLVFMLKFLKSSAEVFGTYF